MKKIKITLTTFFVLGVFSLMFIQKALADFVPVDVDWGELSRPDITPSAEPKTFFDLIEPQHIVIGGAVLVVVLASFVVIFKMRKK